MVSQVCSHLRMALTRCDQHPRDCLSPSLALWSMSSSWHIRHGKWLFIRVMIKLHNSKQCLYPGKFFVFSLLCTLHSLWKSLYLKYQVNFVLSQLETGKQVSMWWITSTVGFAKGKTNKQQQPKNNTHMPLEWISWNSTTQYPHLFQALPFQDLSSVCVWVCVWLIYEFHILSFLKQKTN